MNQHLERIELVAPILQAPVRQLLELANTKLKTMLMIVHAHRGVQEQYRIYQLGRRWDPEQSIWVVEDAAKIVTKAKPGTSAHNVVDRQGKPAALAVDLALLDPETGQPSWDVDTLFLDDLYELSWKVGLDPLGDQIGAYYAPDKLHFEEPAWGLKVEGLGLVLPAPVLMQI